ncbi:YihY/virulence factor BrkB family protein [Bacillus sp. SCS-151]|uniref:YihY/virulence factor BrkB family protein n=1 Tax=Nanhaiella sioensis TaxID=3115293 RepID=UPI00397A060B
MYKRWEVSILSFSKEFVRRYNNHAIFWVSAELAYFFLLSLVPFLLLLLTLLTYLPISPEDVLVMIKKFAPIESIQFIENNMNIIITSQHLTILSIGIVSAIWSCSVGMNAIVRAFNNAYNVSEYRSLFFTRCLSILLTAQMILVILVTLVLSVIEEEMIFIILSYFYFSKGFENIWYALDWFIISVVLFLIFSFLYYHGPNKHLRFREVVAGSIFSTLGWILVSLAFSFYVDKIGNFGLMYGSLSGIVIFMIWLYLTGMIIIIGCEINATIYNRENI